MRDLWSYEKKKRIDQNGGRWHFVSRIFFGDGVGVGEEPYEIYFRNEERTEFGVVRFERKADFPYRTYDQLVEKVMNNADFRRSHINADTKNVWRKSWK